MENKEK